MNLDPDIARTDTPTFSCDKCGYVRLKRGKNGIVVEVATNKWHDCDFSYPHPCKLCGEQIYTDKKILSLAGKRMPLDIESDKYHFCDNRSRLVKKGLVE